MKNERDELTRLEWDLMDALWAAGRGTATDMQAALQDKHRWAYSTVKTMLDRLVSMGYVKARRVGNVYEYTPKIKRPTAVGKVVDQMIDQLFGGSITPFVQHLVEKGDFQPDDLKKLKAILENYRDSEPGDKA